MALFGGRDGLAIIERLLLTLTPRLAPHAAFIVEFGDGQEDDVAAAADREGWQVVRMRRDLQGIARTAVLERKRE